MKQAAINSCHIRAETIQPKIPTSISPATHPSIASSFPPTSTRPLLFPNTPRHRRRQPPPSAAAAAVSHSHSLLPREAARRTAAQVGWGCRPSWGVAGVGGERRGWGAAMAGRVVRSCVQTGLKAVNSVLGLAGMAVILYALWMLRAWYRDVADLHYRLPVPWYSSHLLPPPQLGSRLLLLSRLLNLCFSFLSLHRLQFFPPFGFLDLGV